MPYSQNHPTDTRSVSIVIPVYNSGETIGSLVERLLELYAGEDLEIVLVDDASQDEDRDDHPPVVEASSRLAGGPVIHKG